MNKQEFYVIGNGLSRTGTNTLKTALEILLPGKCYHAFEAMQNDHDDIWLRILNGATSDEEFRDFFLSNGYVAGVSYPFSICFEQAMRAFPDAKIVLTVRDPDKWICSVSKTVLPISKKCLQFPIVFWKKIGLFRRTIPWFKFHLVDTKNQRHREMLAAVEQGRGLQFYDEWVQYVQQHIPKEKLLIYSVKDGWEPLCSFLNLPVPKDPFPHVNSQIEFHNKFHTVIVRSWLLLYESVSVPVLAYLWYRYLK